MALSAVAIAAAVAGGQTTARAVAETALARIEAGNPPINAFTCILHDRARADAARVDANLAAGHPPGPLAGVPFAVKDLFDVAGLPTTAGAAQRRAAPPASRDAEAVRLLCAAGAVLVGTLNMDEFAYGFATDNAHWGVTRNPHDHARLAGGSSGGAGAAVAAGLVPLALGSDTNGSVRVPAALCGIYGIKPGHGGLPMAGVFPFVDSFDDIGPFAGDAADLALVWQVLAGSDEVPAAPARLRIGRLGGWFAADADPEVIAGLDAVTDYLGGATAVELPGAERARAAAFVITAAEGGNLHRAALAARPLDFDPATRDRLLAGALLPATDYLDAQRYRGRFTAEVAALFAGCDVLLAPTCPVVAPRIDQPTLVFRGREVPARAHLGRYTQPVSFVGLAVVAVPLRRTGLPLGLQLIAAPGNEALLLGVAARLEAAGLIGVTPPQ